MKYLVTHKGTLYYRRRIPDSLRPAFEGKGQWRRSLSLPANSPESQIVRIWTEAHEEYELLVEMATNSNLEVLGAADLRKKAKAFLRSRGLEVGMLAEYPEGADVALPELDEINEKGKRQELLTPKEKVITEAYWMAVSRDKVKKLILLSDCWNIYRDEKQLDEQSRHGARVHRRWLRWLTMAGDSVVNKEHIEEGLDQWVETRKGQVAASSIQRELNTIIGVLRLAIKKHRLAVVIEAPSLPKHKAKSRQVLPKDQQVELVNKILNDLVPPADGVALLLHLQGGVIASECQRLKTASVALGAKVPHIVIESDTKTTARKRVVPITVGVRWLRKALAELEDSSGLAFGARWTGLTESAISSRLIQLLPKGIMPYGLRHTFRANAIASAAGDNAALIGGWSSANGISPIMFKYGQEGLSDMEVLKGLEATSKQINSHLVELDSQHLKLVTDNK